VIDRKTSEKLLKRQKMVKTRINKMQTSEDSEDSLRYRKKPGNSNKLERSRRVLRKNSTALMFSIEEEESKEVGEVSALKKKAIYNTKKKIDGAKKLQQEIMKKPVIVNNKAKDKVTTVRKWNIQNETKQNKQRKEAKVTGIKSLNFH